MLLEGLGWAWKYSKERRRSAQAERVMSKLRGMPIFLLPLQLSTDYQIRTHSLFPDMQSAAGHVIKSFAGDAAADVHLLLKAHPLGPSFFNWSRFTRRIARRLGIEGRLYFVDGGSIEAMLEGARGLVCVNSVSDPCAGAGHPRLHCRRGGLRHARPDASGSSRQLLDRTDAAGGYTKHFGGYWLTARCCAAASPANRRSRCSSPPSSSGSRSKRRSDGRSQTGARMKLTARYVEKP
jgi:hypothetical protein